MAAVEKTGVPFETFDIFTVRRVAAARDACVHAAQIYACGPDLVSFSLAGAVESCLIVSSWPQDDAVREGLKQYSDWPTYPQLYAKGELLGGADIIAELDEAGELADALNG